MKKQTWIVIDFLLAAFVAILGDTVAAYFQEQLRLTEPARFGVVAGLFVISLGLLLWLTIKQAGQDGPASDGTNSEFSVNQKTTTVEPGGSMTGFDGDTLPSGASVRVDQEADSVAGEITGIRVDRLGEPKPSGRQEKEKP